MSGPGTTLWEPLLEGDLETGSVVSGGNGMGS